MVFIWIFSAFLFPVAALFWHHSFHILAEWMKSSKTDPRCYAGGPALLFVAVTINVPLLWAKNMTLQSSVPFLFLCAVTCLSLGTRITSSVLINWAARAEAFYFHLSPLRKMKCIIMRIATWSQALTIELYVHGGKQKIDGPTSRIIESTYVWWYGFSLYYYSYAKCNWRP